VTIGFEGKRWLSVLDTSDDCRFLERQLAVGSVIAAGVRMDARYWNGGMHARDAQQRFVRFVLDLV
jgi:hypothetical protein